MNKLIRPYMILVPTGDTRIVLPERLLKIEKIQVLKQPIMLLVVFPNRIISPFPLLQNPVMKVGLQPRRDLMAF